ncbi:hypothetical protein GCM10009551_090530 [Nocardiopsis tropica]|uniref:hypothetical protein n=1 Tax=Tsukamurella strandjordii TaxID=147577 RepID=UPI0031E2E4D5
MQMTADIPALILQYIEHQLKATSGSVPSVSMDFAQENPASGRGRAKYRIRSCVGEVVERALQVIDSRGFTVANCEIQAPRDGLVVVEWVSYSEPGKAPFNVRAGQRPRALNPFERAVFKKLAPLFWDERYGYARSGQFVDQIDWMKVSGEDSSSREIVVEVGGPALSPIEGFDPGLYLKNDGKIVGEIHVEISAHGFLDMVRVSFWSGDSAWDGKERVGFDQVVDVFPDIQEHG